MLIKRMTIIEFEDESIRSNPDKLFLVHILELAVRDLDNENFHIKLNARNWFEIWENYLPHGVSYKDVRDNITLSAKRLEFITAKLNRIIP